MGVESNREDGRRRSGGTTARDRRRFSRWTAILCLGAGPIVAAGCSDSATGPKKDDAPPTFTVDASMDTIYITLGSSPRTLSVVDPATSTDWDLAIFATEITANGGEAGPGGVTVHCVCQNAGATDARITAMTAESELPAFAAFTAAGIPPAGAAWSPTAIVDNPWYWYDFDAHFIYSTFNVYLLKRGSTVYKLQFTGYYGPSGQSRIVQFRYETLVN